MRWMEMIRVLSSEDSREEALAAISRQLADMRRDAPSLEALLLQHALYPGDLAAVLVWNDGRQPVRTREGLMLSAALYKYGSVDHAVWRAATGFEAQVDGAVCKGDTECRGGEVE